MMSSTILIALLIMMLLGTLSHLASRQKLELIPQRQASIGCTNPIDCAADGMPLITNAEKEVWPCLD